MMTKTILRGVLALILGLGLAAGTAQLAAAGGYQDGGGTACGSVSAGWNAPNGAAVMSRGKSGPIVKIIDVIGEYYSHSMLSHGPGYNKWLSHTTAETPGIHVSIFGDDDMDTNELRNGWPGPAQVNMGAGYTFLYRNGGAAAVKYHNGNSSSAATANWFWNTLPYCGSAGNEVCYQGVYSEEENTVFWIIGRRDGGTTYRHGYGVHQYTNDFAVPDGSDTSSPGWTMHCTTFMAWALDYLNKGHITSTNYPKNGVSVATVKSSLHSSVKNECDDSAGWFGGLFVGCGDIADQVVNCFIDYNQCGNDSSSFWKNWNGTPNSISPDRGVNRGYHSNTGSPWSAAAYSVQWNQSGSSYGCWF